jgi:signal transduction histidine kinase
MAENLPHVFVTGNHVPEVWWAGGTSGSGDDGRIMANARIKLLVVDGDTGGRAAKSDVLRTHGYDVVEAAPGFAIVEQCRVERPALVVLDAGLAGSLDGDMCRQMKAVVPDVAVLQTAAAHAVGHQGAELGDGGADAILAEPIAPAVLVATVKALLRMRHAERALSRLTERVEDMVASRSRDLIEANRRLQIESAERRKAEEVLWHAQKLEAVGQLTGGIAHDFNNLLCVIVGSLDMMRASVEGTRRYSKDRLLRLLGAADIATDRSAKLTQQLLAFARRSVLSFDVVVIPDVLTETEGFLRRAVGEQVELKFEHAADLWPCRIDPVQFEAAIVNLAVNARDAMPAGGMLTIRTRNLEIDPGDTAGPPAGAYVVVEVTDTGSGMDKDVAKHAFEPFFTTKDIGKGTGLGLSQVYGFVTQSGGHVAIESEVGAGATVRIFLPRSQSAAAMTPVPTIGDDGAAPTGSETILIVEDNAEVLELVVMTLSDLGYQVMTASNARGALDMVRRGAAVDLLFSDVMMPGGMNGFDLVRAVRALRPKLKALVTSGYANVRTETEPPDVAVLTKPYAPAKLARTLRALLDPVKEDL